MTQERQHYKYRPQKEYRNGFPLHKKIILSLEKFNKILFLRLLGKLLKIHPLTESLPLEKVSSVLIIRYDALGDMIVTTPLWRILKRYKPSIKIGVAGSFKNLDLLRADTDIDILYDYTASSMRDFFRISKETRKNEWDVVLMGNFNQRTRNAIISRLASKKGITATIGFRNAEGHQTLFSRYIQLPSSSGELLMTEQLQYLLRSAISLPEGESERPLIMLDQKTDQRIQSELKSILSDLNCSKYLILNIDAPSFKKWPLEKNLQLAGYISNYYPDYAIFITSLAENRLPVETALTEQKIERALYFPTPDIHAMISLIRTSSLVITPDTSIVHLASAENKPVVAFYLKAGEWLPYGINSYIIIPKKGELISTISFEIAKEGVRFMLDELPNTGSPIARIVRCENPKEIEFHTVRNNVNG